MDNILDPAWHLYKKPFQDESLILEDWIPLGMMRQALQAIATYCDSKYNCCGLYTFEDWHEKNGQLSRRERTTYADWWEAIATDDSLWDTRPASGLYRAYYSETADFLLRYAVIDAPGEGFPKAWGDFSFSGESDDIRAVIQTLNGIEGLPLNLIGSAAYFEATYGR